MDLFETPEVLPELVQHVLIAYEQKENTYSDCEQLLHALQSLGYTFEYGLDAIPSDLREMTEEEKRQYNTFIDWLHTSDQVIQTGADEYKEQSSQYKIAFTKSQLFTYCKREFSI